jgi:hypothetical protein
MPFVVEIVKALSDWRKGESWCLATRTLAELLPIRRDARSCSQYLDLLRKAGWIVVIRPGNNMRRDSPIHVWVGPVGKRSGQIYPSLPVMAESGPEMGKRTGRGPHQGTVSATTQGTKSARYESEAKQIGKAKPEDLVAYYLEGLPHMRQEMVEKLNRECPEWQSLNREELNRALRNIIRRGYNVS